MLLEVNFVAYSELIKNFERIRDYMREFYVYGFKSRNEYTAKSARSYDNERRRIESWLGDFMLFKQNAAGKNVFLSVDSRQIPHNPLYKAFKAKSFTNKDIALHFYILDILYGNSNLSLQEIIEAINDQYLSKLSAPFSIDESTIRKKLKEYESLGILSCEKKGREVFYKRTDYKHIDIKSWADALSFYSEDNPLGVIGSFLIDKLDSKSDIFRFKHHYMLHALDSDILCQLLTAISEQRSVELDLKGIRTGRKYKRNICPLKIYISTQSGRQYILGYHYRSCHMLFFRLDAIKNITIGNKENKYSSYIENQKKFDKHLWGVSSGVGRSLDYIEMTIHIEDGESFIFQRLNREKRHGRVEVIDEHTCKFTAEIYDATEMLPWLRTFIGRISDLKCSNKTVIDIFYDDINKMNDMYGGENNAL